VHELFEEQAAKTPQAVAVAEEDREISYAELNRRANRLAHYLVKMGVVAEVRVGICSEPKLEMVVALMGILKAGGAYVPIDPEYPSERIRYILEDTKAKIVLTGQRSLDKIRGASTDIVIVEINTEEHVIRKQPADNLQTNIKPRDLAYVIYTSGTTGRPKGVMVEHAGLLNYLQWAMRTYAPEEGAGSVVSSSFAFDATVTALYTPLLCGRSVVLLREGDELEGLEAQLLLLARSRTRKT